MDCFNLFILMFFLNLEIILKNNKNVSTRIYFKFCIDLGFIVKINFKVNA